METRKLYFAKQNPDLNEKKSKLKINGMHMRNLLLSLCEAEISSSKKKGVLEKKLQQLDATLALKIMPFPWIVPCKRRNL